MNEIFLNEWHQLRVNLLRVAGWLRFEVNNILEPYELTQQQFNALRILRGQLQRASGGSFSTQDLRDHLLDRSSDASRLAERLHSKGLLTKSPCQFDSRKVNLKISEKGLALLSQIDQKMNDLDSILQVITVDEAILLNSILKKFPIKTLE